MRSPGAPAATVGALLRGSLLAAVLLVGAGVTHAAAPADSQAVIVAPQEDTALAFDATAKEYAAKPGEESCVFRFQVRNTSDHAVVINQVRTSCGCTVAKLPEQPWHLAPGAQGELTLTVDLRGKSGEFIKTATIDTPTTFKTLLIKVTMPSTEAIMAQNREQNVTMAKTDRQAVFKGECATCHAAPAHGRFGRELYVSACAICHDAAHRATMVPDLHAVKPPADAAFWRATISHGRDGTLMPAFAQKEGGPLTDEQIESLVTYLTTSFARHGDRP